MEMHEAVQWRWDHADALAGIATQVPRSPGGNNPKLTQPMLISLGWATQASEAVQVQSRGIQELTRAAEARAALSDMPDGPDKDTLALHLAVDDAHAAAVLEEARLLSIAAVAARNALQEAEEVAVKATGLDVMPEGPARADASRRVEEDRVHAERVSEIASEFNEALRIEKARLDE